MSKESEKKVFFGGTIITMNPIQPITDVVGILGEKIVAIGDLKEVKKQLKSRN